MRRSLFVLLIVILSSYCRAQSDDTVCRFNLHSPVRKSIEGYQVEVRQIPETDASQRCQVTIVASTGKRLFRVQDWSIDLSQLTTPDVDGDGHPEIVIEGYSGGAHCCWTYWIFSFKPTPRLLAKIENDRGIGFRDENGDGRIEIVGLDGSFDYFDGLCHACTVFPSVFLRFEGGRMVDVSPQFVGMYDKEIAEYRHRLDAQKLAQFKKIVDPNLQNVSDDAKAPILGIVLAYLYSGRSTQAWGELRRMWPESDYARIKREILAARARGLRKYCVNTAPRKG